MNHTIDSVSNIPLVFVNPVRINSLGNSSLTNTLFATSGPLFVTIMVQEIISPFLEVAFDTSLIISRSASGSTTVVLLAMLLDSLLSGVVELTTATLIMVAFVIFTLVVIIIVEFAPLANSPMFHNPVVGSYLPPELSPR